MAFRVISAPDADRNLHIFDSVVCHLHINIAFRLEYEVAFTVVAGQTESFHIPFMSEELHSALYPL